MRYLKFGNQRIQDSVKLEKDIHIVLDLRVTEIVSAKENTQSPQEIRLNWSSDTGGRSGVMYNLSSRM